MGAMQELLSTSGNIAFTDDDVRLEQLGRTYQSRLRCRAHRRTSWAARSCRIEWACAAWLTQAHWRRSHYGLWRQPFFYVDGAGPLPNRSILCFPQKAFRAGGLSALTFSGSRMAWVRWRITNCCCGSGSWPQRIYLPDLRSRRSPAHRLRKTYHRECTPDMAGFQPCCSPNCWAAPNSARSWRPAHLYRRALSDAVDGRSVSFSGSGTRPSDSKFE